MTMGMIDVYGEALNDYYFKKSAEPLILYTNQKWDEAEEMPLDLFFRDFEDFPEQEKIALALCDGKVLDVGAGVGSHSLHLQSLGFDVTALELSSSACEIIKRRGLTQVLNKDIFAYQGEKYDTLLFMMNGIGLVQTIPGLKRLLAHAKTLLNPGGQLLFDSSDVRYYYGAAEEMPEHYFGEITFQYEYKKQKGAAFGWLYIDQDTLIKVGHEMGWVVQILDEDEHLQYLARMELKSTF